MDLVCVEVLGFVLTGNRKRNRIFGGELEEVEVRMWQLLG
jgi:hypothetical protein